MWLSALVLRDFRNIETARITPQPGFNILVGANGQGKTNTLEALFWLATLRPFRAGRLRELVRWGHKSTRVEGIVESGGLQHRLAVAVEGQTRIAFREEKRVRASEYFGPLGVVLFTPDDVGLVRGSPADRRKFLDRAIFTGRASHLEDVLYYRKALDARNRLLRDGADSALVEAYEGPLAAAGARLTRSRVEYIEELAPRFETIFGTIAGDVTARMSYRASIEGPSEAGGEDRLLALWREDRARDRQRGFTQRGPHVDDLKLFLGDRPAKAYASQGQQRAMVLAMKIGEIEVLKAQHERSPVLLLDDVSSELDPVRNARLFEFLNRYDGQAFVTTTDRDFLRIEGESRVWNVAQGVIQDVEI